MKREKRIGYTVCLGEATHKTAQYCRRKDQVSIEEHRFITSEELRMLGKKAASMAVSFCPRTIYADLGEFSCVSDEATKAHIRSTIDKTGLFNEHYSISFKKIYDIDKIRGKFSYLAIPAGEISQIDILDENETFLDTYCPIEASIAAVVARKTDEMSVTIFEDKRHVRIIGSKQGAIYHLITLNKADSFDLPAETISGLHEMTSLLRNSYSETPSAIFIMGENEITREELEENDIHVEPFEMEGLLPGTSSNAELIGTVLASEYNFTPERFRETRRLALYSKYSLCISALVILISLVLLFLGVKNTHTAQTYENRSVEAQAAYVKNLSMLEKDYNELCTDLDFSNINSITSMYRDFEAEPKLYTILGAITSVVPEHILITKITVARPGVDMNMTDQGTPESSQQRYSTQEHRFSVAVEGIIKSQYPQSKNTFARFLAGLQESHTVHHAEFSHTQESALFQVAGETKP